MLKKEQQSSEWAVNLKGDTIMSEEKVMNNNEAFSMEKVIEYVKTWNTYEEEIKAIRDSRTEWAKDFIEDNSLPKKELSKAMQIVKQDLDADVISSIIEKIESLLGD